MKRSIILFLVSFMITAGIGGGVYYAISQGLIPGVTLSKATPGPEVVTQTTTEQPTDNQPTEPTATDEQPTATDGTDSTPATDDIPSELDPTTNEPATGTDEPTVPPVDAPTEPTADRAEQATDEPATTTETESTPRITLSLTEAANSSEHELALKAREALRHEDTKAAMDYFVERGGITPQAAVNLLKWAEQNKPGEIVEVADLRRPDGNKVTRYRLKSENGNEDILLDVVTNRSGICAIESATPAPADKTAITADCDHITASEGFIEAVRHGNMNQAREMITGEEISMATVAGLCMVFEEGNFELRKDMPIRNTFYNDDFAGNMVYVTSAADQSQEAQIGLNLNRTETGWRVTEVGLAGLLSSYENSANEEGGRYFPIVKNPKGGDSLALFFGFNEADLTPRSLRQLQIVADMLKGNQRKLNISGHTDDVGSEGYNLRLSERRADAVKAALVGFGVNAEQITTNGLGKSQPRRTYTETDTEQTVDYIRGENRRAEIYLDFE